MKQELDNQVSGTKFLYEITIIQLIKATLHSCYIYCLSSMLSQINVCDNVDKFKHFLNKKQCNGVTCYDIGFRQLQKVTKRVKQQQE